MPDRLCNCDHDNMKPITRRGFFERAVDGIYGTALASLLSKDLYGDVSAPGADQSDQLPGAPRRVYDLKPRPPEFKAQAKSVIQLFMHGGPSQVDLFDYKPTLEKHNGESYFDKLVNDLSFPQQAGGLLRSPFAFKQYGQSGMWVSELMPHVAEQVDNIALIRSMFTIHPNHEPALFVIHSGRTIQGRPSLGAWVVYGLGTENQNLPAYVVLDDPLGYTYFQMKKLPEAKKNLDEALGLDPSYAEAGLRLGEIAYMEGQDEEALRQLLPILAAHPQYAEVRYTLAKIYLRQSRFKECQEMLLNIVQQSPQDPRFHYLLAALYRKTGQAEAAKQELSVYETMEQAQDFQHRFIRHSFVYVE